VEEEEKKKEEKGRQVIKKGVKKEQKLKTNISHMFTHMLYVCFFVFCSLFPFLL
jgi:hypothetical protein